MHNKQQVIDAFNNVKSLAETYAENSSNEYFQEKLNAVSLLVPPWWPNWGNYLPFPGKSFVVIPGSAASKGKRALEFLAAHELGHAGDPVAHVLMGVLFSVITVFSGLILASESSFASGVWLILLMPTIILLSRLRGWKDKERRADETAVKILGPDAFLEGARAIRGKKAFLPRDLFESKDLLDQ